MSRETRQYTDEERAQALELFEEHGATYAAEQIGCARKTIYEWLKEASRNAEKTEEEQSALAAAELRYHNKLRGSLRRRLLTTAHSLMDRIDEPHFEWMSTKAGPVKVDYPTARSGDIRAYATAVAIFLDKYRLEMGESTDRTEMGGRLEIVANGIDINAVK